MPPIEHNGPEFRYRVEYSKSGSNTWTFENILDWRRDSFTVLNTHTFAEYDIKVTAFNKLGQSNVAAEKIIGYSGEDGKSHWSQFNF